MSFPPKFSRVALNNWQTWRLDQPLQSHPTVNTNTNPILYSSEPRKNTTKSKIHGIGTETFHQPLQSHPKINTDTNPLVYSSEPRTTHNHIKNLWNRHRNVPLRIRQCGDHTVTTVTRSQLDGVHRRALKPRISTIRKTTPVVHVQNNTRFAWTCSQSRWRSTNPLQCCASFKT